MPKSLGQSLATVPALRTIVAKYGAMAQWPPPSGQTTAPRCPSCHDSGWTQAAVPFGHPEFGRAQPCRHCDGGDAAETPEERAARLWQFSGIAEPERARCTFAAFDLAKNPQMREARDAAQAWSAGEGPPFLLLHSATRGLGKTHLAIAAAAGCIERGLPVVYEIVPSMLDRLRATFSTSRRGDEDAPPPLDRARRRAETYPAAVFDDLGADKGSDWADEQLFSIVNERSRRELRTLVTTNVPPNRIESRVYSRLVDSRLAVVIGCKGQDVRARRA